ncbi:glycoside hydrolase superfamily [Aspergillus bertholletiae]|uniref:chitinase n=1 Tax=Aspergillus bertholletiae TaxID=1226010 RepID=A0A5N7BLL0_9EURO|nr:glycoside hydrolase superfamily [Aspergillus bertholletiae]
MISLFQSPNWRLLGVFLTCLVLQASSRSIPWDEGDSKSLEPRTCSGTSSAQRYIGYYNPRDGFLGCDALLPSDINVDPWTHIYVSFENPDYAKASVIAAKGYGDYEIWKNINGLKSIKPSLKTYLSFGRYTYASAWSNMTNTFESRKYFIDSAIIFMKQFGFNGLDLDITGPEYMLGGPDEKAIPTYRKNFVSLLKEFREAFGTTYGLTATISTTECGLTYLDLPGMIEHLDFLNFVTENHDDGCRDRSRSKGWQGDSSFENGLKVFKQAKIDPNKLSLMLRLNAVTHKFSKPDCQTLGCPWLTMDREGEEGSLGDIGECTRNRDKSFYEIERVMKKWSPEVHYNQSGLYNWFVYDGQMVQFDNAGTLKRKADLANKYCLGGLAMWDIRMGGPATLNNPNYMDPSDMSLRGAPVSDNGDQEFERFESMRASSSASASPTPSTSSTLSDSNIPSDSSMASAPSTPSASASTETSTDGSDTKEGLSCHPAIGSAHVPIAQQDCDSNSASSAPDSGQTPTNAEESTPLPIPTPTPLDSPSESIAISPKPTLSVIHRIGTPVDTSVMADYAEATDDDDEDNIPDESTDDP